MSSSSNNPTLLVAKSKNEIPSLLHECVVSCCIESIAHHGAFIIALSGGSITKFLSGVKDTFDSLSIDPEFDKWHVCLADERLVPLDNNDSNMKALKEDFLDKTSIPSNQIHPIDVTLLGDSESVASSYEKNVIAKLLSLNNNDSEGDKKLDLAILGFGPDGHTCSLFPNHKLLSSSDGKLVDYLEDSPKPPPQRITLTFKTLNEHTRNIIFCGAGESKNPILKQIFTRVIAQKEEENEFGDGGGVAGIGDEEEEDVEEYEIIMNEQRPFPCSQVNIAASVGAGANNKEEDDEPSSKIHWVVDVDAIDGVEGFQPLTAKL